MRSSIGLLPGHVRTLQALGLRRIRATVVHDDTAVIRGMIGRVPYALQVEPVESDDPPVAGRSRRGPKAPKVPDVPNLPNLKERSA
jgi:large subunit ribosomal protein L30